MSAAQSPVVVAAAAADLQQPLTHNNELLLTSSSPAVNDMLLTVRYVCLSVCLSCYVIQCVVLLLNISVITALQLSLAVPVWTGTMSCRRMD